MDFKTVLASFHSLQGIAADVNDGHNTRDKIKAHDPMLAMLLMHAYGDGPWRYTQTMPRQWGGQPR